MTKPESQVKGKAPESRGKAKNSHVKPKSVKVAGKKHPFSDPITEDASNHNADSDPVHEKPPLSPRIHKELDRWKAKAKDVCFMHFPLFG